MLIVEDMYKERTATIKLHMASKKIPIKGSDKAVSIFFFFSKSEETRIRINQEYLNNLILANYVVLMSESTDKT